MKAFNKPIIIKRGENYYKIDINGNYEKLTKSKISDNLKEKLTDDSESYLNKLNRNYDDKAYLEKGIAIGDGFRVKPVDNKWELYRNNKYIKDIHLKPSKILGKSFNTQDVKRFINSIRIEPYKLLLVWTEFQIRAENYDEETKDIRELKERTENKEEEATFYKEMKEAVTFYKSLDEPFDWILSNLDYFSASERVNEALAFIIICSQVINMKPYNLILLASGGSGKTKLMNDVIRLIPDKFVIEDGKSTFASMVRRFNDNPYYFSNKFVNLGDFGGKDDKENQKEVLDLYKVLTTDDSFTREMVEKVDGEMIVKEFKGFGRTSMSYATTPDSQSDFNNGEMFDSQELSRSIIIQPRTDNYSYFKTYASIIDFPSIKAKRDRYTSEFIKTIQYVLLWLRQEVTGIKAYEDDLNYSVIDVERKLDIYLPYNDTLSNFIGVNDNSKRDYLKYKDLLSVIALLNLPKKEIYSINNNKAIYVDKNDIDIFQKLMKQNHNDMILGLLPYESNILFNIIDIYEDLNQQLKTCEDICDIRSPLVDDEGYNVSKMTFSDIAVDEFQEDEDFEGELIGQKRLPVYYFDSLFITVNSFMAYSKLPYSMNTIIKTFEKLVTKGYLVPLSSNYNNNKYYLDYERVYNSLGKINKPQLSKKDKEYINLGFSDYHKFVNDIFNDRTYKDYSVQRQYKYLPVPLWRVQEIDDLKKESN